MRKILGGLVVAAVLLTAGVASACDWCYGHAGGPGGGNPAAMRKFHKDTAGLREDLAARQIDLAEEYDKDQVDPARIAAIRKEIVDLEAKIQAAADKSGVRPWGPGRGHGMMAGGSGRCGCW
jgi:hypothetical protein